VCSGSAPTSKYKFTRFESWSGACGLGCEFRCFCTIPLIKFRESTQQVRSQGSSVSIVSDYGLDDRAIEDRSPTETKDFSSNLCVQTGSGAHPVSCTMGIRGPFPGAKRGRGVTLTTHPHLVPRSRMSRSYTSSPPKRHHGV
jgi:hypothetical protein